MTAAGFAGRAPSRRAALAGMSAALLCGCDPRRAIVRAAERAHGCVDVPVPPADGVRLVRRVVPTRAVKGPFHVVVAVPENARVDAVAYLLPGRGSDAEAAMNVGFAGFLADYVRRGGAPFAIAAVDAGETYFHRRTSGEDRWSAVTRDVPAAVREVLGVPAVREALIGQSMGGYGALLAAEREPRRFRAVGVAGPAIFPSFADEDRSVGDAFDSASDYARNDVIAHAAALREVPVLVYAGRRDPFVPGVRLFAKACPHARVVIAPGCHDEGFWRATAPHIVSFVGTHLRE